MAMTDMQAEASGSDSQYAYKIPSVTVERATTAAYDIIIVGAGVLGSALSHSLARSGRSVLVVERDLRPPHSRCVGELLQSGGCISLDKLGLLDCVQNIDAVPCKGYVVIHASEGTAHIPYPVNGTIDEPLPPSDKSKGKEPSKKRMRNSSCADEWNSTPRYEGRSFHHGRFVGALRRRLEGQERLDVLEATVNDLVECETMGGRVIGVKVTPKSGDGKQVEILAPLTIVADGHASKFRKIVNTHVAPPITRSYFVGIEMEDCVMPNPNHGHVILPDSADPASAEASSIGPVLVYGLCPKVTRMLVDVNTSKAPSRAYLLKHIIPRLPECMKPSFAAALADDNPQKVKIMPNSWLPPSMQGQRTAMEGVFLAGDALNMRHPLTGGGMSVALNDTVILTRLFGGGLPLVPVSPSIFTNGHANGHADGNANGNAKGNANGLENGHYDTNPPKLSDAEVLKRDIDATSAVGEVRRTHSQLCDLSDWMEITSRLEEWHWERKGVATCVNVLAMALYSLFGADDDNLNVLRRGCIRYIGSGGERTNGPVSMLAALRPSPPLLVYHFFAVALFSIRLLFTAPRPPASGNGKALPPSLFQYPALFVQSIFVFLTACRVILPVLWSEVDF